MAAEGVFPKSDGDVLYASEVNEFNIPTFVLYEGSAIDVSLSATSWTATTASTELTVITSSQTQDRDYIKVGFLGKLYTSDFTHADMDLNFYIKETGGSYSLMKKFDLSTYNLNGYNFGEFIYPLTSGMKTNGFQVKVETTSTYGGGFGTQSSIFTNEQIKVEFL